MMTARKIIHSLSLSGGGVSSDGGQPLPPPPRPAAKPAPAVLQAEYEAPDWGAHPGALGYPGSVQPGHEAAVGGDARHDPSIWSWSVTADATILPMHPALQAAAGAAAAIQTGVGAGPPLWAARRQLWAAVDWAGAARRLKEIDDHNMAALRERQQAKAAEATAGVAMHADASRGGGTGGPGVLGGGGGGGWGGAHRYDPSSHAPGGGGSGWGGGSLRGPHPPHGMMAPTQSYPHTLPNAHVFPGYPGFPHGPRAPQDLPPPPPQQ